MTPLMRRLLANLPALWTAVWALAIGGQTIAAAIAIAAILGALAVGPVRKITSGTEVMIGSFLILAAAGLAWLLPATTTPIGLRAPGEFRTAVLVACLFVASFRAYLREPLGYDATTICFSIIAALGFGGIPGIGALYVYYLAGLAIACVLALRALDPGRIPLAKLGARGLFASLFAAAIAGGAAYGLSRVLPPVSDSVQAFAVENLAFDFDTRKSGFSRAMSLGTLRKIVTSDAKVMRVEGLDTDHLRGVVYDRYRNGQWFVPLDDRPRAIALGDHPPAGPHVEIQMIGEETARYFVPLDAAELGVPSGAAEADGMGVVVPAATEPADRIWFAIDPKSKNRPPIGAPTEADREVPPELRAKLEPLAKEWTSKATTGRAKLEAIVEHLQTDYNYALEISRDETKEPIVEFLFDRKTGHCEYFASAMALLARTASISARVAGGYLVTEKSELGDYWIVRQSNAHAWVEAYVDGAWATFDPTPPSGLAEHMKKRSPPADALGDLISAAGRSVFRWLKARTVGDVLLMLALALAIVFRTELRALVTGRRRKRSPPPAPAYSPAWPELEQMLAKLEERGIRLAKGETLEHLATRIADDAARDLLRRYTQHRFGGIGDAATLQSALAEWSGRN